MALELLQTYADNGARLFTGIIGNDNPGAN
jgi:hypothetical protein